MADADEDTTDLHATLERLQRRARAVEELRATLPCYGHDDEAGASACEAVSAFEACEFARGNGAAAVCPRARVIATLEAVRTRLVDGHVPERERELILAAVARRAPLIPTEALQAVRARIAGRPWTRSEDAHHLGREVLFVLAGPRGVGKTLAGCYAIGRLGGRYVLSYALARKGLEVDALVAPPVVVVDQLGREAPASDWFASQFEELIDRRYANRRLTILVGNITRAQFGAAYDKIIEDRMRGDGAFIVLAGESLRGGEDGKAR